MGIGTSLVLIAAGAILRFAVSVTTTGFNLHTIGLILMIVGAVGLVISLFFWNSWGGFGGGGGYRRERRVVSDGRGGYVDEERGGTM
jgi:hypothetical protein